LPSLTDEHIVQLAKRLDRKQRRIGGEPLQYVERVASAIRPVHPFGVGKDVGVDPGVHRS
jgi:hypothetical protein